MAFAAFAFAAFAAAPLWWWWCFVVVVVVAAAAVAAVAAAAAAAVSAAAVEAAAAAPAALLPAAAAAVPVEAVEAAACCTATQLPKPPAVVKLTRQRLPFVPPVHLVPAGSETASCCEPTFVGDCGSACECHRRKRCANFWGSETVSDPLVGGWRSMRCSRRALHGRVNYLVAVLGYSRCRKGLSGARGVDECRHLPGAIGATNSTLMSGPALMTLDRDNYVTYALKLVMVAAKDPSALATMGVTVLRSVAMLTLPHSAALLGRWTSLRTGVPVTPRAGEMMACACAWMEAPSTRAATK